MKILKDLDPGDRLVVVFLVIAFVLLILQNRSDKLAAGNINTSTRETNTQNIDVVVHSKPGDPQRNTPGVTCIRVFNRWDFNQVDFIQDFWGRLMEIKADGKIIEPNSPDWKLWTTTDSNQPVSRFDQARDEATAGKRLYR